MTDRPTSDVELDRGQRLARMLGRRDVLEELSPVLEEIGEEMRKRSVEAPKPDDPTFFKYMAGAAVVQALLMAKLTARVNEITLELADEVTLLQSNA